MAEEVRRSGRANKGHHTKNQDALDEPVTKPKPKPKVEKKAPGQAQASPQAQPQAPPPSQTARAPSAQSEKQNDDDDDEEDDAIIRCVCGDQRDIRGRQMICCDKCSVWQHNKCLSLPEGDYWEDRTYYCEQCKPEDHVELLAAMARGERPWARKKGNKPKPRASDVKQEGTPRDGKASTPQSTKVSSPTPNPVPPQLPVQPASTSTSTSTQATPASVTVSVSIPTQPPKEPTNGHADPKTKKETPKSQPQSPLGEKRRLDSVADKEAARQKRRKSSQQQEKAAAPSNPPAAPPTAPPSGPPSDIDALPQKQKVLAERLRDTLVPLINAAADSKGYRIPDGETARSLATRFTLMIDHATLLQHGEPAGPESPFVKHQLSVTFNVKQNSILVDRLLSGSLTAQELATMAPEEMASEEKQKEFAAMREAAEKQMILTEEAGPRIRKTHKGEEIVGEDGVLDSHEFRQPQLRERESVSDEKPLQPQSPFRNDQNASNPADRTPLSVDTSGPQSDGPRRPSTNFDINSVFDKVRSPQHDQQAFMQRRQSSIRVQEKPQQGPVEDTDIDRLLKDEDGDVGMGGYSSDPTVVWQGSISMQSMEPFDAVARFVAGGDFGPVIPWDKLLSPTLPIQGRIESQKGDEYIKGLAQSGSHDVGVLAISPVTTEGRAVMDHLYNYFHPRDRWGVVPIDKLGHDAMRDLYVIPIEPGGGNLPPFLDMLEYCTIETPRREHMILLALIAKLPEVKPQPHPPQLFGRGPEQQVPAAQMVQPPPLQAAAVPPGPSPSPIVNPQTPQYSPMGSVFPPTQYPYPPLQGSNGHPPQAPPPNVPIHRQIPKAVEILGPFIDAPVIAMVLTQNQTSITEVQMNNLRHIVEHVPEARTDFHVLSEHLRQSNNGQP